MASNSSVPLHQLGKNGPSVPALGLGTMGLSYSVYGSVTGDEERFALLDSAYEMGVRHWDSSDLYGDSEQLLGRWFKRTGKRDEIFLTSKYGYVKGSAPDFKIDSSAEYCKKACAESLKELGVDSIDLYYLHHPNTKTPIEQSMRALAELKSEGKIKHIGLSNVSDVDLRRAVKIAPVAAVQLEYSPFVLDIEGPKGRNMLATCRELGVAVVAYSPLGRGLLTSTFASGQNSETSGDMRAQVMPRFMGDNRDKNVKVVNEFKALADKKGCTITQLALAWLLKQGDDIFLIPGTKKLKYLEDNRGAVEVQLSDEEEAEIRKFVEKAELSGARLPEKWEDTIWTNTVEEDEV